MKPSITDITLSPAIYFFVDEFQKGLHGGYFKLHMKH